jgi:ABC-2 type transport system ATP-binding protein
LIEVKNLTKRYGKFTALQNISLSVDKGGIYGLVGYNGAGKTTLLKNISGVYKPEEGTVFFDSKPVFDNPKVKEKIFFIPDDLYFGTYANMNKMANFYNGYYSKFDYSMFKRLTAAFGLDPTKRINGFSKGMQRQAEIVLAMSTHPDLILLDESFDGIDPQKRVLIKGLLMEYINDFNAAVIISSHNLTELEDLCTDIGIINGKKIAITGKVTDLSFGKSKYRLAFNRPFTLDEFSGINCQNLKKDGQLAMFTVTGDSEEVQEQIKALNPAVIERINLSLEEIFLEEMEGGSYDFKNILV